MFLGLLNPDLTSELLRHLSFFKFSNLKVQNRPFFVILYMAFCNADIFTLALYKIILSLKFLKP